MYQLKFTKTNCSFPSKPSSGSCKHSIDSIGPKYVHQRASAHVNIVQLGRQVPEAYYQALPYFMQNTHEIIYFFFWPSLFLQGGIIIAVEHSSEGSYNNNTYIYLYLYLYIYRQINRQIDILIAKILYRALIFPYNRI